ncbi:unnamed protein product [Mytilus coruscus]|uniref:LRAT domain-containing protein n=1 Tax=Mytilus coruscus TaxID=42192 RepID=A0A6J8A7D5_MYTCO|nr:unnamed protein product [Mytilus coruscus]
MQVSFPKSGYKHHAIVTNVVRKPECYEIIHMTGDAGTILDKNFTGIAEIRKERKYFDANDEMKFYDYGEYSIDKIIRNVYKIKDDNEGESIVSKRASLLYDAFNYLRNDIIYNPLTFNCEHLASYCATGLAFCKQKNALVMTENRLVTAILDKK